MTPSTHIDLLEKWVGLLREAADVQPLTSMTIDELNGAISKRQEVIDAIQQLDGSLRKIAKIRSDGWPGLGAQTCRRAEILISCGITLCNSAVQQDREVIENATEKRRDVLGKLRKSNQVKGYFVSAHSPVTRPPVIVDDNA